MQYTHFLQYLKGGPIVPPAAELITIYSSLLSEAKSCLNLQREALICPHNVVMTLEWMIVIPRRAAPHVVVSTPNSAGMMGSVWLPMEGKIDAWKQSGPVKVLSECGVPSDNMRSLVVT